MSYLRWFSKYIWFSVGLLVCYGVAFADAIPYTVKGAYPFTVTVQLLIPSGADSSGTIYWGDGTSSEGSSSSSCYYQTSHVYTKPGEYLINRKYKVTVTNDIRGNFLDNPLKAVDATSFDDEEIDVDFGDVIYISSKEEHIVSISLDKEKDYPSGYIVFQTWAANSSSMRKGCVLTVKRLSQDGQEVTILGTSGKLGTDGELGTFGYLVIPVGKVDYDNYKTVNIILHLNSQSLTALKVYHIDSLSEIDGSQYEVRGQHVVDKYLNCQKQDKLITCFLNTNGYRDYTDVYLALFGEGKINFYTKSGATLSVTPYATSTLSATDGKTQPILVIPEDFMLSGNYYLGYLAVPSGSDLSSLMDYTFEMEEVK